MRNIILLSDSYKFSHYPQYREKTEKIYSYYESRGTENPIYQHTVWWGLQAILMEYLEGTVVTKEMVEEAKEFCLQHFGQDIFNYDGWMYIVNHHEGKLPVKICAPKEGSVIPLKNVLLTIENTDPKCFWLTNFLETLLSKLWYPCTIATNSFYIRKTIEAYQEETCDEVNALFSCHDFGYRGVSSEETASIGGAAHLTSFMGSDTVAGITYLQKYYGAKMPAYSVPAAEHSTITSWGREHEDDAIKNMLTKYPTGIVSVVADSYNVFDFCERIGRGEIKEMIMNRDGRFVVRPDSGDPVEVVSKVLDILWKNFGGEYNSKGYKVLDKHIRILQGDGIDLQMIDKILSTMKSNKFAAENIVFGSGGGLLQKFNRDTLKFAIKCSYAVIDGVEVDVRKDPFTDSGKKSKQGRLKLHKSGISNYTTISSTNETPQQFNGYVDELIPVFVDGEILVKYNIDEVREEINKNLSLSKIINTWNG